MNQTEGTSPTGEPGIGRGCGCLITIAVFIVWFAGIAIIETAFYFTDRPTYSYLFPLSAVEFLFTFGVVWVFWIMMRAHNPLGELGLIPDRKSALQFINGLILGAAGVGIAVALIALGGGVSIGEGHPSLPESEYMGRKSWLLAIVIFLFYAVNEEIIMRGFLYPFIKRLLGFIPALVVSTLVFTLMHLFNTGFSVIPFIDIFLAGVFLVLLRELTGNLWLAWGAHFAWNFALVAAGLPVSGHFMLLDPQPYHIAVYGPDWLTGGLFGPEGGLSGVGADLFLIAITAYLLYLKGKKEVRNAGTIDE